MMVKTVTLLCVLGSWVVGSSAFAASASAALLKAKKEAEAKGFIFETSHDAIVAKAKKEGFVQVLTGFDPRVHTHTIKSFRKKYPFLQVAMLEIQGSTAQQRFIMELKASGTEFDIVHTSTDFYPEYPAFAKKFDILGMAEHGVLSINPKMVDPNHRTVVAQGHALSAIAYNKNLVSPDRVPDNWEDFLKPEFKGRKFLVDIRPRFFAMLAACMGEEWMVRYAKKIRAQEPIWFRGHSRSLTAMIAGEYMIHSGTSYHTVKRLMNRDRTGTLQLKLIEPVPVRLMHAEVVMNSSSNPYASLLFLEHEASPEGQSIIDKYEPLKGNIYTPGAALGEAIKGKKVCIEKFESHHNQTRWMKMAVKAFGFPKAERKRR